MCYAFSHLPLLDRDAFPPAREEKVAALVLNLEKRAKTERDLDNTIHKTATILAWYHRGPWTDDYLAKRVSGTFGRPHASTARVTACARSELLVKPTPVMDNTTLLPEAPEKPRAVAGPMSAEIQLAGGRLFVAPMLTAI